MKQLFLSWMGMMLGLLPGYAQNKPTWSRDSLRYREYVAQATKLGTAKRDSALDYAEKALRLAQSHRQPRLEATSFNQIGRLAAAYGVRVEYHLKAVRIYERLEDQNGLGDTYIALAEVIRLQSNGKYPPEVLAHARNALDAYQKARNSMGLIQANNMIGIYHAMTGQPNLALRYFEEVKQRMVAEKMDSSRIMSVETNLANLLSSSDLDESLRRRLNVYAYQKRKDGFANMGVLSGIAYSYRAMKRPQELIRFAKEGLADASRTQNVGRQVGFHEYLRDGYEQLRDFEPALHHANQVQKLSDSLSKQSDAGLIAEAQQKYQNEKKQAEIERQGRELAEKQLAIEKIENQKTRLDRELALRAQRLANAAVERKLSEARFANQAQRQQARIQELRLQNLQNEREAQAFREKQRVEQIRTGAGLGGIFVLALVGLLLGRNRILRRKNADLQTALLQGQTLERRRVAADLHDSLGGLLSSLRWQMQQVDEQTLDEKQRGIFRNTLQNLTDAYQRVRLISHNLLPDDFEKQGLTKGLAHLAGTLNRAGGIQIDLEITGLTERLPRQTEFEVYSIALELLTNVLKHADATEAFLALERHDGTLHLTVSDNGRGWNGETTDGRGWQNIRDRVASLRGTVEVRARSERGTEVAIAVPV